MGIIKTKRKTEGFTIIEVMFVLAIGGLLMVSLMIGITGTIQQQRFKDSIISTQAFLQQQYDLAMNIQNDRNGAAGACDGGANRGTDSCVVLGRLIKLYEHIGGASDEYQITAYDIIGKDDKSLLDATYTGTLLDYLNVKADLKVASTSTKIDFIIPWGTQMNSSGLTIPKDNDGEGDEVSYIAILRSPKGGELHVYKLDTGSETSSPILLKEIDKNVVICLSSAEMDNYIPARLLINGSIGSQNGVTTQFDIEGAPCQ